MNRRISQKVVGQIYKHNFEKILQVKQNVIQNKRTYQTINFSKKSEYHFNCLFNSERFSQKTLCCSTALVTSFYRNASTETATVKDVAIINKPDSVPVEEITVPFNDAVIGTIDQFPKLDLTGSAIDFIVSVHEEIGFPWWASIALSAVMIRTFIILPFAITQFSLITKHQKVEIEMLHIKKRLKIERIQSIQEFGYPEELADKKFEEKVIKQYNELIGKENCHPIKTYWLILFQVPAWLTFSAATNSLCHLTSHPLAGSTNIQNEMMTGGLGWITDLTATDPYFILPIAIGIVNLCILEVHQLFGINTHTKRERIKCLVFRAISVSVASIATLTPAAVNIYWLSSSTYGLLQAFLLNSSLVRRLLKLPVNDPQLEHPYQFFYNNLKSKLNRRKN